LAHGFARVGAALTVIGNVGDDVELHGLAISPDLDSVLYTLAELNDEDRGWGLRDETYTTLAGLTALGEDTWFTLGDQDFATHIARTAWLRAGAPLSAVTARLTAALGVTATLLPVTDDRIATLLDTPAGRLAFQDYFVRRHHSDDVTGIVYDGIASARPAPGVLGAIDTADVLVIAPSNPFLSIFPVLDVPGVRERFCGARAPRVAVSPIVGGQAIKGPAAQILETLGHDVSAVGIARLYGGLVGTWVIDGVDAALAPAIEDLGHTVVVTDTIMGGPDGRERLARDVLAAAGRPLG
jgi:LPPG:FO 2-phospho-L-lactate transferase